MSEREAMLPSPGWQMTTLGEAFRWGSGGTPNSGTDAYYGGAIPWAVIGDLNDTTVTATANTLTPAGLSNSSAKWVEPGSVLVAMYGSIGKLGIAGSPLTTNQAIAFATPSEIESKYLFWYLARIRERLRTLGKGGTQQNISQTVLKAVPFPLAPLAEQRRIVAALEEHLSDLDAAVAGLGRARANLRRFRGAVLRSALPADLPHVLLGDVTIAQRNGISAKPDGDTGLPILRISAVRPMRVDVNDVRYLMGDTDVYADYALREGDLLFTRYNGNPALVGACAMVGTLARETVYPDKLIRVRIDGARVDPRYAQIVLSTGDSRAFIQGRVRTTAGQAGISGGDLRQVPMPLVPLAEQRAIVADVERRLTIADRTAADLEAQLARAARLRQAILRRAFEGRLVPQDPADEPAAALLARIRAERAGSAQLRPGRRATRSAPS